MVNNVLDQVLKYFRICHNVHIHCSEGKCHTLDIMTVYGSEAKSYKTLWLYMH